MRRDRRLERGGAARAPRRDLHAGLVEPALDFMDQLHAVSPLARLKVEALGPHPVVQRGERDELLFARLHDGERRPHASRGIDRKSTRLNSSHSQISYAVFCLKKKKIRRIYSS